MTQLTTYFATALKAEIDARGHGFLTELANKSEVSRGQVSDIAHGRAYGGEETRRALAKALGWDYEEFLKYGQCLYEGREYIVPNQKAPAYDPDLYQTVPLCDEVELKGVPGSQILKPVIKDESLVILMLKSLFAHPSPGLNLAAFRMTDESMEPTILNNGLFIIDTDDRDACDGNLYALYDNDKNKVTVRRIGSNQSIFLICDNTKIRPKHFTGIWDQSVIGRVIFTGAYF